MIVAAAEYTPCYVNVIKIFCSYELWLSQWLGDRDDLSCFLLETGTDPDFSRNQIVFLQCRQNDAHQALFCLCVQVMCVFTLFDAAFSLDAMQITIKKICKDIFLSQSNL